MPFRIEDIQGAETAYPVVDETTRKAFADTNMNNFSTPAKQNQPQNYEISAIAPQIIADVALQLMSDRLIFSDSDAEIRFGNRGSFSVNKRLGVFRDYEAGVNGGIFDMICHLQGFEERHRAFDWLQDNGFLDGTFTPTHRPRPQPHSRPQGTGNLFKVGQNLWDEATPVPNYQHHPVRHWCRHRNLFPSYKQLPPTIRWHEQKYLIIVALVPVTDFVDSYPEPPQPRQFHLISVDKRGNKGNAFGGDDKRTYGRPGVTCIALFGNPNADEIGICEGVADALSLTSDFPCVIASLTTPNRLASCRALMTHLTNEGRAVYLCSDNDRAGKEAEAKLANTLASRRGEVYFIPKPTAKDPAAAAAVGGGCDDEND